LEGRTTTKISIQGFSLLSLADKKVRNTQDIIEGIVVN